MKNVKGKLLMILGLVLLLTSSMIFAGCSAGKSNSGNSLADSSSTAAGNSNQNSTSGSSTAQQATNKDTDGDGIPDAIEKTYGTNPYAADTDGDTQNDKQDSKPLFADNPIKETSTTKLPVKIKDARVEDNATADHLEITLSNSGNKQLGDFDIYYTITDKVTGAKEAYYQKLDLTLAPSESCTLHFDNKQGKNHYPGNVNGLYGASSNGLTFDVTLHSAGYQLINFQVEKAKGTAEVAD